MQVNQTSHAAQVYQTQSKGSVNTTHGAGNSVKASSGDVHLSKEARNAQSALNGIANRYDVTNISTRERGAMVSDLQEKGLLSNEDAMRMAAPFSMNENIDTKRDWLQISKDALAFAEQNGQSPKELESIKRNVSILEQLFELRDK
ncbi:hypothetical protein ACMXYX_11055 [Neptuniibacter sp. QD72_48]|uniref:hypothetical protein n=1 Tax=unclassified Neptuniibacter TaxID=2630693 RepID=UPI0039F67507